MKKLRVGILFGGRSGEHEISLLSAASVFQAIDKGKFEVVPITTVPAPKSGPADGAVQILSILQRDARLVDFLMEDVSAYSDEQVGAAVRAARVGYVLAEGQLRRYRQAVAKDVSTAFYDALVARELAALADEDVAQKERHLEEATRRRTLGTATDYDVLAADVAVQNARPAAIRARNAVRTTRDQLRFLLAETSSDVDVVGTLAADVQPPPDYAAVVDRALRSRPELGELASQRDIYRELVAITRASGRPRVDFASLSGAPPMNCRVGFSISLRAAFSQSICRTVMVARDRLRSTTRFS